MNKILQKQPTEVFYKKGVLKNFAKFTEKTPMPASACNVVKKETLAQVFYRKNFAKFIRTPFIQNTSGALLLKKLTKSCSTEQF